MIPLRIEGQLWVGDPEDPTTEPVLDGHRATIEAERTDVDEVAIHATLPGDDNALVSIYLTTVQALAFGRVLEREAFADVRTGTPAS